MSVAQIGHHYVVLCPGFSGSDVFMKICEYLQVDLRIRYHRDLRFRSIFQVEKGPLQQSFLQEHFPDTPILVNTVEESNTRPSDLPDLL
jgi:hypothetical protein